MPTYTQREGKPDPKTGKTRKVWTCIVDAPPDPVTGKRRQRRLTAATKRELDDAVTKFRHEVKSDIYIEPTSATVRDYLAGSSNKPGWLASHRQNIRETTYRSYEQLIRVHILPALGNVPLQKLTATDLEGFYTVKLESGLSPRTVRYLHTVLRKALQRAYKTGQVSRNVADMAEPPKAVRPQVQTWDVAQLRRFLATADGDTYDPAWLVEATTGLRRGELLGLRWDDVDLAKGRLHIRQSLVEVGTALRVQEPKTKSGRRVVPLTPSALAALKEHRTRQLERRLKLGPAWHSDPTYGDLVFSTGTGRPIGPRNFFRRFKELSAQAGLPPIALHGLRHAAATLMLREGIPAKVVSERLGHASIALTLDTYSHVLPDMQDAAIAAIETALSDPVQRAM